MAFSHSEPYTGGYEINGRVLQFIFFQHFELSFLADQNTYEKLKRQVKSVADYCVSLWAKYIKFDTW